MAQLTPKRALPSYPQACGFHQGVGGLPRRTAERRSHHPQVYMFLVKWQDLSEKLVYRRFTEIYEFHVSA